MYDARRAWLSCCVAGLLPAAGFMLTLEARQSPVQPSAPAAAPRAVVDRYCVSCHSERLKTAGLALDGLNLENVPADAAVWEKVIRKLRTNAMPPAGRPRPDAATYASLTAYMLRSNGASAGDQPLSASTDIAIASLTLKLTGPTSR